MCKTVTISQSLLNDDELKIYTDFIYGFLESNNWKVTNNSNVLILTYEDIHSYILNDYDYIIFINKKSERQNDYSDYSFELSNEFELYEDRFLCSSLENNNISIELYILEGTILFITNKYVSKGIEKYFEKYIDNNNFYEEINLSDHDLGYKLGILLSEACISDEILRKREMNKQ